LPPAGTAPNKAKKIAKLRNEWQAEGKEITISGLAAALGMCRKTIRAHLTTVSRSVSKAKSALKGAIVLPSDTPETSFSPHGENSAYKGVGFPDSPPPDLQIDVEGDVVELWLHRDRPDLVINKNGAYMSKAIFEPYMTPRQKRRTSPPAFFDY
jgi:hypothetical protein